ncbi:MAG: hypothetical protein WC502_11635, partial [Methanolinea sp.]
REPLRLTPALAQDRIVPENTLTGIMRIPASGYDGWHDTWYQEESIKKWYSDNLATDLFVKQRI